MKRSYYLVLFDNTLSGGAIHAIQKLLDKEAGRLLAQHDRPTIEGEYGPKKEARKYQVTDKKMFTLKDEVKGIETLFIICNADRIK